MDFTAWTTAGDAVAAPASLNEWLTADDLFTDPVRALAADSEPRMLAAGLPDALAVTPA